MLTGLAFILALFGCVLLHVGGYFLIHAAMKKSPGGRDSTRMLARPSAGGAP